MTTSHQSTSAISNLLIPAIDNATTTDNLAAINAAATSAAALDAYAGAAISTDAISAAGLKNINVDVDAQGTISAASTAKSTATSNNVSDDAVGLAYIDNNSGLLGANTIGIASDAQLSATAVSTVNASASTSNGDAAAYGGILNSAGVTGLDSLTAGGELSALGKAVNTITASAETVVEDLTVNGPVNGAQATAELITTQVGFNAADIDVSSNASIQGLSQLTNSATAASTTGASSLAEALAGSLTGADLNGLLVGGTATVAGQSSFGNTSNATNVVGKAEANSELNFATGLNALGTGATHGGAAAGAFGIDVSSDATLTGLASITSAATAATTDGVAKATSDGGALQGLQFVDAEIGGVGSITGQSTFTGNASSSNVTGGNSTADSTLTAVGGFDANDFIDVSSDATLKGLSSTNLSATAESTGVASTLTVADAAFIGGNETGASLEEVTIGGIGNVLGQVGFNGAATANNVTGKAEATGDLASALGLATSVDLTVSSDATLKGIASVTGAATAATTAGDANAAALAANINGADFNDLVDIGGLGSIQGAANFNLSAKSTNVTAGLGSDGSDALAGNSTLQAIGLQSAAGVHTTTPSVVNDFGIDIASDASISGTAIGTLKAEATSTATSADALAGGGADLWGAQIADLNVGGIANVTGAAQLTGTATAENVGALNLDASASAGLGSTVTGLAGVTSTYNMDVASDATITAQAFGTLNATASSTGGDAAAHAGNINSVLTGLASGLDLDIGGVGTLSALAQGSENASATTVAGIADADAGMTLVGAKTLDFDSSSDGSLTGIAKLVANVDASNIGAQDLSSTSPLNEQADATANGEFSATGFSGLTIGNTEFNSGTDVVGIGGISTLKGQAQIAGTLNAESVSGDAFAGVGDNASIITGMSNVILNGASDGTVLGTAAGVFNTSATSTIGDASGFSSQTLRGINQLDLNLGGNGGINAIVNDTNFVSAHSVSGNATAIASVDAIGLNGGDIHIAGNATILANVGVDSKAEAGTIG